MTKCMICGTEVQPSGPEGPPELLGRWVCSEQCWARARARIRCGEQLAEREHEMAHFGRYAGTSRELTMDTVYRPGKGWFYGGV